MSKEKQIEHFVDWWNHAVLDTNNKKQVIYAHDLDGMMDTERDGHGVPSAVAKERIKLEK